MKFNAETNRGKREAEANTMAAEKCVNGEGNIAVITTTLWLRTLARGGIRGHLGCSTGVRRNMSSPADIALGNTFCPESL